jgi:hypothetical protein
MIEIVEHRGPEPPVTSVFFLSARWMLVWAIPLAECGPGICRGNPGRPGLFKETCARLASTRGLGYKNRILRFESWSACEMAVIGRKGAKFKKVKSAIEEQQTLAKWGVL